MSDKSLKTQARNKALLSILVILGVVVAEVLSLIVLMPFEVALDGGIDDITYQIVPELFAAIAAIGGVALLGGSKMIPPSWKDISYTFRFGWWCLAVTVGLLVYEMIDYISMGTVMNPDWLAPMIRVAILCLLIGLFEEFLFRGVVFQALLGVMGATHRGVVRAVIITSVIFGIAHVDTADFSNVLNVVQALLKITQTGLYSFMLCTIVLRTHKLGGVSLFHGLDDFLIIAPSVALYSETFDVEYVVEGEDAVPTIIFYLLVIALYMPFVIKSALDLHREQYVYRGAFMEEAVEGARLAAEQEARLAAERAAWERTQLAAVGSDSEGIRAVVGEVPWPETSQTGGHSYGAARDASACAGYGAWQSAQAPAQELGPAGQQLGAGNPTQLDVPGSGGSRSASGGRPPRPSGL